MISLYGAVFRRNAGPGSSAVSVTLCALVYLVVWAAFGIPVFLVGRAVDAVAMPSPAFAAAALYGVALVLLAAGV